MDLFGLMEEIYTSFECAVISKKTAGIDWGTEREGGSPTSPDFRVSCSVIVPSARA